ncbi:MAG: hypothetical protein JKY56_01265 [Kofleriaceae bacterium]|nr:hypothetical protein [Kofleriaceae bacterium]
MQKTTSLLLLLPLLASAACGAEFEPGDEEIPTLPVHVDSVRVEFEVIGPGKISIVTPDQVVECTDARPLCSYDFPSGTELVIEGDFSAFPVGGWAEDCIGRDRCLLTVDRDTLVVASFGEEPDNGGLGNDEPGIIVDPVIGTTRGLYRGDAPARVRAY